MADIEAGQIDAQKNESNQPDDGTVIDTDLQTALSDDQKK